MGRIVIDPNDPPPRANALGKKLENAGRPTADINPSPALRQLDPVEQRSRHRRKRIGLTAKTLGLEPVTPKSVCRRLRLPTTSGRSPSSVIDTPAPAAQASWLPVGP
jgi:hypothetical protein